MQMPVNKAAQDTLRTQMEIEASSEIQAKEIEALDNRHLAQTAWDTTDKGICAHCGDPMRKSHGLCDPCKAKRAAGEIPPLRRAEPTYKQKQCVCGNWFEPTHSRTTQCVKCEL